MVKNIELSYTQAQLEIFFNWPEGIKFKGVAKGRRFGATKGAANAIIEWCLEGVSPILWGDTVHGNIDRYFERYFLPELKKNDILYHFDKTAKKLTIGNSVVDFRSAEHPENWEGFGYKIIFLNEAGIILKNKYLYTNAVLPMLMDYPDSKLIAAGVPKGKILKDGTEHPFYTICKKQDETHMFHKYSSYDNPLIKDEDIDELRDEIASMSPHMVAQEIYGDFIEAIADNPFAHAYDVKHHEHVLVKHDPSKQLIISIDFNLDPFGVIFGHIWRDSYGEHAYIFDELSIKNGSIDLMVERIQERYGDYLFNCLVTGDSLGRNRNISQVDHASNYELLRRGLRISQTQLKLPANPSHETSRNEVNNILTHFPDFKINPIKCPNTVRDMKIVQVNAFNEIVKRNRKDISQLADHLDCVRYFVHTFLAQWIATNRQKYQKK